MPEIIEVANDAPVASCRMPAADTWKILYTATAPITLAVHVGNTLTTNSGFRLAVVPAAEAYTDGTAPPQYSILYGGLLAGTSVPVESASPGFDTPALVLEAAGDRIVVYAEDSGVTFFAGGFIFS